MAYSPSLPFWPLSLLSSLLVQSGETLRKVEADIAFTDKGANRIAGSVLYRQLEVFFNADGEVILNDIEGFVPAIQQIIAKKKPFYNLLVTGSAALVKQDLGTLNTDTNNFQNALNGKTQCRGALHVGEWTWMLYTSS
ncbi:hypothetical protein BT96DRAFT_937024 [Gymnopus androsaceus JB14]|uniref:Uncharacterized protein n=1 Tax=Gymnopus androsaceus JB14 TaxID=1447944 RepID=A0A6A4I178_9AGAR|nr:hypothetical protein BT96DRAFT_937024 [Gymnopus androsaceus JB14]